MAEVTAEEIAASRPPDTVEYGAWEPDPDSKYERVEWVARETTLFKVLKYEEVRTTDYHRDRRKVIEYWKEGGVSRIVDSSDVNGYLEYRVKYVPASTVARQHWEYQSRVRIV